MIHTPQRLPSMALNAPNLITHEEEAGGSLSAQGQTRLHSEFQDSLVYSETLTQKKK